MDRVFDGLFHWYRLMAKASPGGRVLERDGVLASLVPAAPERAVANAVVCGNAGALQEAYDEIAASYRDFGAKWTVWVRPDDDEAAGFLESRGHVLDAQPYAMAHDMQGIERPPAGALPDWTADGDFADVGPINDRAYDFGTDSFTRALGPWPSGATHAYVARDHGEPVGCLLMTDHDGNTDVEMVAVVPEARGRGITRNLLGHALADAAERGSTSSTLVATRLGYPVYERLGFRPLEQASMWELAPSP
jgi:GNAT superfamily N-acetyltransferase